MLTQADVERAAMMAAAGRHEWHVMIVHRAGVLGWTINYSTPRRFVTVNIPVDAATTKADAQRRIEDRLPS